VAQAAEAARRLRSLCELAAPRPSPGTPLAVAGHAGGGSWRWLLPPGRRGPVLPSRTFGAAALHAQEAQLLLRRPPVSGPGGDGYLRRHRRGPGG